MQIVSTTPGHNYSLTFAVGDAADGCYDYMLVEVYAGRRTLQVPYESNGNGGFKKASLEFSATEYESHITFLSSYYLMKYDGTLCGPIIDDIVHVSAYQCSSIPVRTSIAGSSFESLILFINWGCFCSSDLIIFMIDKYFTSYVRAIDLE